MIKLEPEQSIEKVEKEEVAAAIKNLHENIVELKDVAIPSWLTTGTEISKIGEPFRSLAESIKIPKLIELQKTLGSFSVPQIDGLNSITSSLIIPPSTFEGISGLSSSLDRIKSSIPDCSPIITQLEKSNALRGLETLSAIPTLIQPYETSLDRILKKTNQPAFEEQIKIDGKKKEGDK